MSQPSLDVDNSIRMLKTLLEIAASLRALHASKPDSNDRWTTVGSYFGPEINRCLAQMRADLLDSIGYYDREDPDLDAEIGDTPYWPWPQSS